VATGEAARQNFFAKQEAMRDQVRPSAHSAASSGVVSRTIHQETHEMKIILTILAAAAALSSELCAQSLTVNSGFTVAPLFTDAPGADIFAIGSDSSGNIYYLDSGTASTGFTTQLIKRTAASQYQSSSVLYTYSGSVFGDFVKVNGSTVYFGESTNGTIQAIGVNGGTASLIAKVPFNYDMAFNGTTAFVDAVPDSSFTNNTVSMLNLSTGALTPVLKTSGASGPIAFSSTGSLLYGASTFKDPGGIYSFSASQIAAALTGTPLTLSAATPIFANGPNQYLASLNSTSLFGADSSSNTTNLLSLYNPTSLTSQTVGQIDTAGEGDLFDGLAVVGNGVAVGVSSQDGFFGQTNSEVFLVTPEPGSAMLLALGGAWMLGRRRFRAKRQRAR
jgi:hypothetical protein